jgi:hypothetical protein
VSVPTDDRLIAAILAAAILQKEPTEEIIGSKAVHIVQLYFECLEAIHAERLKRYTQAYAS